MKKASKIVWGIVIFLAIAMVVIFLLMTPYTYRTESGVSVAEDDQVTYTQEQVDNLIEKARDEASSEAKEALLSKIKEALETGRTVISVLKELYPDKLVVASSGMYHWVDIIDNLDKHEYAIDNIVVDEETGEYTYVVDGQVLSKKGIDVSSHQGKINWDKVKADGVEFVFVRGIYRGYGSGKLVIDENCLANIDGATAAGLDVGVYVFSQAITEAEAIEEADEMIKLLDGRELTLPIVFDVEKVSSSDARMNQISIEERTDIAIAFLEEVRKSGYEPMVYHNTEMGAILIDISKLEKYDKWFAGYNKEFYWPYKFGIWQYTENGHVDGIDGAVDMDIMLPQ